MISEDISRLYSAVVHGQVPCSVSNEDMEEALRYVRSKYKKVYSKNAFYEEKMIDYDDAANRCAYIHTYAALHTFLAYDVMDKFLSTETIFRERISERPDKKLKICSLGGGPGNDLVGILPALFESFGQFTVEATVVDVMSGWIHTLQDIIDELNSQPGQYGLLNTIANLSVTWKYLTADLCAKMTNELNKAIGSADILVMIKFVSAVNTHSIPNMLQKIFRVMKPGAIVLFIDNASGDWSQKLTEASEDIETINPIYDSVEPQKYSLREMAEEEFGSQRCVFTSVAIQVLMKNNEYIRYSLANLRLKYRDQPIEDESDEDDSSEEDDLSDDYDGTSWTDSDIDDFDERLKHTLISKPYRF